MANPNDWSQPDPALQYFFDLDHTDLERKSLRVKQISRAIAVTQNLIFTLNHNLAYMKGHNTAKGLNITNELS